MKPYGREKKVKGGNSHGSNWKRDYHLHENGKKVESWWEGICDLISRSAMKQKIKKDIQDIEN